MVMGLNKDTVIWAAGYSEENIEEAKKYCKKNGFTFDDVKICKVYENNSEKCNSVLVKVK